MTAPASLKRALSLWQIALYGLGTIIGAGAYVLVGKVAGHAGLYAPIAFLLAAVVATLTAFAYAELSARYPVSAGEAVYVQEGLRWPALAVIVGLAVTLSGLTSAATLSHGFAAYLDVFVALPRTAVIVGLVLALGALAAWGIAESAAVAIAVTLIEVAGLVFIIAVASDSLATLPQRAPELLPPLEPGIWYGIALGAFLAFFAFIGFEDMVNVAEEVREPELNLPRGILLALGVATLLYLLVALVAVLALPQPTLTQTAAPFAEIYRQATGEAPWLISLISLFAVVNGALVQIIMGARVLYGMAHRGWLPPWVGYVSPRTRTPLLATAVVCATILLLALVLPIVALAKLTSFVILSVFCLVNLALVRIKLRAPRVPGLRTYPAVLPVGGFLTTLALLGLQLASWLGLT
jgi:amino acid transporter